jgi:hypothetical protein
MAKRECKSVHRSRRSGDHIEADRIAGEREARPQKWMATLFEKKNTTQERKKNF